VWLLNEEGLTIGFGNTACLLDKLWSDFRDPYRMYEELNHVLIIFFLSSQRTAVLEAVVSRRRGDRCVRNQKHCTDLAETANNVAALKLRLRMSERKLCVKDDPATADSSKRRRLSLRGSAIAKQVCDSITVVIPLPCSP
jgi:hypothetical protein